MSDDIEAVDGFTASDEDVAEFGAEVQRVLGFRPAEADLAAALGAVAFRDKQASSKLSPVEGKRSHRKAIAPYCSSTYASFASCPSSCSFLKDPSTGKLRGCFVAANVYQMRLMKKLDASAARIDAGLRGTLIGLAEAYAIDRAFSNGVPQDGPRRAGRILRIHVAGDAANAIVAMALAAATERWYARGGGPVWSYTHRWRTIPRTAWGSIAILASVETAEAATAAMARGYASAITIAAFAQEKAYPLAPDGASVLPCPHDVSRTHADGRPITCASCGWCFDDRNLLQERAVIGFKAHGGQDTAARASIEALTDATTVVKRHLHVL